MKMGKATTQRPGLGFLLLSHCCFGDHLRSEAMFGRLFEELQEPVAPCSPSYFFPHMVDFHIPHTLQRYQGLT